MRSLLAAALLLSLAACKKEEAPKPALEAPAAVVKDAQGNRLIALAVTEEGFVPSRIRLKKGEPVKFVVIRKTDTTCATELLIAGTDLRVKLPLNQPVEIAWTPTSSGTVKFGCAMGMMVSGVLLVE